MTESLNKLSLEDLDSMVQETEASLEELKLELLKRREAAEHAEIEQLEVHLEDAGHKLHNLRDFFRLVLAELRGRN